MKNITDNLFLNPFWLLSRLTFGIWPVIGAIAGAGLSLWGQDRQRKDNNEAIDEANQLEQERWEQSTKLALEANRLENARKLLSYARDSGFMGGNQADFTKAKNNFHRSRLATLGYLPKLDMNDPDVKQAVANVGVGASPHDVYNELDRIAFHKWADGLDLDYRFDFEGDAPSPSSGGGSGAEGESPYVPSFAGNTLNPVNRSPGTLAPSGQSGEVFNRWRDRPFDPRIIDPNPSPNIGGMSGNFNHYSPGMDGRSILDSIAPRPGRSRNF